MPSFNGASLTASPILPVTVVLPVAAETWDGWLNDINGFHVNLNTPSTPSIPLIAAMSKKAPSAAAPAWSATVLRVASAALPENLK
jgi:hypothetical protein